MSSDGRFAGLAEVGAASSTGGIVRPLAGPELSLGLATDDGYYEMGADLKLRRVERAGERDKLRVACAIPTEVVTVDAASVLMIDDAGRRWRLPKGDGRYDTAPPGRVCREVCTERDLLNVHGTLYELPAENAGGFSKLRPISSHDRQIADYCSWRGLLVLTGVAAGASGERIVRSDDGQAAVWLGAVDDLWTLGKPRGHGGPWNGSAVKAGAASDPYLFTGYDRKRLELSHDAAESVTMRVEVDVSGAGDWRLYRTFAVPAGETFRHQFPVAYGAYWLRTVTDHDCQATAWLTYD